MVTIFGYIEISEDGYFFMKGEKLMKDEEVENAELFYDEEYYMENMYYFLYTKFNDDNDQHFMYRIDPKIQEMTKDEIAKECLSLVKLTAGRQGTTPLGLLENYIYPNAIKKAIPELKKLLKKSRRQR